VVLRGLRYVSATVGVTNSHRCAIATVGVTTSQICYCHHQYHHKPCTAPIFKSLASMYVRELQYSGVCGFVIYNNNNNTCNNLYLYNYVKEKLI